MNQPQTGVPPIPAAHYDAIFKPRTPANDRYEPQYEEQPFDGESSLGGGLGLVIMFAVVFWIVFAVCVGRAL